MKMVNQIVRTQNLLALRNLPFQRAIPRVFFALKTPLIKIQLVEAIAVSMLCTPLYTCQRKRNIISFRLVKFIYSEKATRFCEIFPLLLTYVLSGA